MIKISYNEKWNALIIDYTGAVDAAQFEEAFPALRSLSKKFQKGFRVLADFTKIEKITPEVREPLKKIMDFLNAQGVREVIRIIPDSDHDVGFNIMSAFHYSKEVKLLTLSSWKEADAHLSAWETKLKIAFTEIKEAWQKEFIKKKFPNHEILFFEETAQEVLPALRETDIVSVFVNSQVGAEALAQLSNLKCISTRSTGFDHIDLTAARAKGIAVCNVPVYGENTVAEHTFALILSLSRNLRKAYLRTAQNNFSLDGLMGFDLKGKTLGVIGTGHIGLHVIRIAAGFGMKIIAYDVKKQPFFTESLNFEYVSLEDLLGNSDVITLHAPYLPSTHHLININNISLIKKGAVLVNTARGGLIQTEALVEALDKKILAGAGLDVLEEEEYFLEEKRLLEAQKTEKYFQTLQTTLKNHVLLHYDNVIFTPHMAFCSYEAVQRILETTVQNIQAFSQGRLENTVSKSN